MTEGTRIGRAAARVIVLAAAAATIGFIIACASTPQERQRSPGLYNLTGWNHWNGDANGEVGHQVYISGPTALCAPSRRWSSSMQILSGSLPPGLSMDSGYNITGIPTRRGHWILKLKLYDVECGGSQYRGFTQDLRIHIAGSGRVVE
jgi:hypothetical protein